MKTGFRGYNSGCRQVSQVWGLSLDAPGNHFGYGDNDQTQTWSEMVNTLTDINGGAVYTNVYDDEPINAAYPRTRPPDVFAIPEPDDVSVDKELLPADETLEADNTNGKAWNMYAAKVPAIWPQPSCTGEVPISSKEDNSWFHDLGWSIKQVVRERSGPPDYDENFMMNPRYCYSSRAIFVDGVQQWISYCTSDWAVATVSGTDFTYVSRPYDFIGVHSILPVNITENDAQPGDANTYRCTTFGGITMDIVTASHSDVNFSQTQWFQHNTHEIHMLALGYLVAANGVGEPPHNNSYRVTTNAKVNCRHYGKQFYVMSSYKPGTSVLGTSRWAVGRIEYDGIRYDPSGIPEGGVIESGTAQSGTSDTIRLESGASGTNDFYKGDKISLTGGEGSGQVRTITEYIGSSKDATVDPPWTTEPDATTDYEISAPGIQAFCSPASRETNTPQGDLGYDSGGYAHDGQYVIVLPSARCYIDTSAVDESNPHDECWVIAFDTLTEGDPQVITAQWKTPVYRSGLGTSGNEHYDGAADGTLHADDVAAGNTILDVTDSWITTNFPEETWEEIRIWCYNRVYNPTTRHSTDLVLFSTQGVETTTVSGLIADFESSPFDPQYLDNNIDDEGLTFVRSNSILGKGYGWIATTDEEYEGASSALAELNALIQNTSQLELTLQLPDAGQIEFYYWFDNRKSGNRFDPPIGGGALTNFPEVDHVLKITVNGQLVDDMEVITDPDGAPSSEVGSSVIDNENMPSGNTYADEGFYEQWRKVIIPLNAGTNTIRWIVNRKYVDNNGHLIAYIDKVVLPTVMIGDDINAVHRWFFDGTKVRENPFWAWARRDEEDLTSIIYRASTVPDFITMLADGRIALGNPHYVAVLIYNEEDDEWELDPDFGHSGGDGFPEDYGFIRFTASPNIEPYPEDCEDPDDYTNYDELSDPPAGCFQILPTSDGGFQLRCVNAAIRDATHYPIDTDEYTFVDPRNDEIRQEKFKEHISAKESGAWATRAHCWTISSDGKTRVPHVEVIWRPTRYLPAWPEHIDDCTNPPYREDFDDAEPDDAEFSPNPHEGGIVHYRDPIAVAENDRENRTVWTLWNYIIPRTYCDALSRTPQAVWTRILEEPEGDNYWEPGNGTLGDPRNTNSPWSTARWIMTQLRFIPITRNTRIFYNNPVASTTIEDLCPPPEGGDPSHGFTARVRMEASDVSGTAGFFTFPDFDAVYEVDPGCEGYPTYGECQAC